MGEVEKGFGQITGHIFAIDEPNRLGLIATYAYLCFRADSETRECYPSQTTIGNAIGVKRETVNRYIKRLEELGLITKVAQSRKDGSGQTSSRYKITAVIPQSQGCDSTVTGGVIEQSQGGVTERSHEHNHKEHNQKNNIYIYQKKKSKKKAVIPEWELNPKKKIQEATEEEKQELLQQLEELRNKEVKENG